jgi:hypothetical protein
MARFSTAVTIERPRAEVFAYLTDLRNASDWATALVSRSYDGPIAVGTTGVDSVALGRREIEMPWVVTAYQPPDELVIDFSGSFAATSRFSFTEAGSTATVMRCDTWLRPKGLWRLLAPILAREARREDAEQFQNAKRILEERGASAAEPAVGVVEAGHDSDGQV